MKSKSKYVMGIFIIMFGLALSLIVMHKNSCGLSMYQCDYVAQVRVLGGHAQASDFPQTCSAGGHDYPDFDHYDIYCGGWLESKLIPTINNPEHVKDLFTKLLGLVTQEGYKPDSSPDVSKQDPTKRITLIASGHGCHVDAYYAPENQEAWNQGDNGNAPPPFDYTKNINYTLECSYKYKSNLTGSFESAKCSTSGVKLPSGYTCKE